MSGCDSGIYAITHIITDPYIAEESPEDSRYWIDETKKKEGARLRVKMEIEIRLSNRPVFRSELKEVSGLENLSILKQPQGTNFPVTDDEWKIISSLMKQ
jgi:predicted RNA-binding protein with PUA-like domain